jgi:hypothetical protein
VGEKVPIIPERGFGLKKLTDSGLCSNYLVNCWQAVEKVTYFLQIGPGFLE